MAARSSVLASAASLTAAKGLSEFVADDVVFYYGPETRVGTGRLFTGCQGSVVEAMKRKTHKVKVQFEGLEKPKRIGYWLLSRTQCLESVELPGGFRIGDVVSWVGPDKATKSGTTFTAGLFGVIVAAGPTHEGPRLTVQFEGRSSRHTVVPQHIVRETTFAVTCEPEYGASAGDPLTSVVCSKAMTGEHLATLPFVSGMKVSHLRTALAEQLQKREFALQLVTGDAQVLASDQHPDQIWARVLASDELFAAH